MAARAPFDKHLWQRNYYERIIRDQDEWNRIHLYIESNPSNWATDEENPSFAGHDRAGLNPAPTPRAAFPAASAFQD